MEKKVTKRISKKEIKKLKLIANSLRIEIIKMISLAGSGHPAGSLSITDILVALYFKILNHHPKNPSWKKRDRLILSPGHICPALYAVLAECGYFPKKELKTLRKINSRLQGHPSRIDLPGIELSTASLGQGLGVAVGMALAAKLNKEKHFIYCITSDGEHDEGSTWEAINAAQKYHLNNLINIIDRNKIQLSGNTEEIWPLEDLKQKYLAFNWEVLEMNGNKMEEIIKTIQKAQKITRKKNKPIVIIAHTIPGKSVSFMESKYQWHGKAPNKEETHLALKELEKEREMILEE